MNQIHSPSSFFLTKAIWVELPSGEDPSLFPLGEVLEGRVIQQIDDRHAVVQFKGHDLLVESDLSLPNEMRGSFRVEATHPCVILKLLPEEGAIDPSIHPWLKSLSSSNLRMDHLFETLSFLRGDTLPPQVRDTVEQLVTLLGLFSTDPSASLDQKQIQRIVTQSGLFFENRVKGLIETHKEDQIDQLVTEDLKGLVMKLRAQLSSLSPLKNHPDHHPIPVLDFEKDLEQILQGIKGHQIINIHSSDHPGRIFFLLPLWVQNDFQFIEMSLSLSHPEAGRSDSGGISLLFLLRMPEWGRLCVEVRMRGKGIYCRFVVSDPEVSAFLDKGFPELLEKLNGMGFQPHLSLSVETDEGMVQDWFGEMEREGASLLDLIV